MSSSPFALLGVPGLPSAGRIYPRPLVGGTNSRVFTPMFAVEASLGANANVHLHYLCLTAPANTLKAQVIAAANATSGNARLNISWAAMTLPENFDTLSLSAEGVQSIAWGAGNAYELLSTKITLDAATAPTAGQVVVVQLGFETASWTLAAESFWSLALIDE